MPLSVKRHEVNAVSIRDTVTILAATNDGLWRCGNCTDPLGFTWDDITPPALSDRRIHDVHYAGGQIWVGTEDGVFRGAYAASLIWLPTNFPAKPAESIGAVKFGTGLVYAGYRDGDVFKSQDFGTTVTRITGAQGAYPLSTLAIKSGGGAADNTFYAGTPCQQGIFKHEFSLNGPRWTKKANYDTQMHYTMRVVQDPDKSNTVYATVNNGLWRSDQGGNRGTWFSKTPAFPPAGIHKHGFGIAPTNVDVLYLGTGHGFWGAHAHVPRIWRSFDGGDNWDYGGKGYGICSPASSDPDCTSPRVTGWNDSLETSLFDIAVARKNAGFTPAENVVYIATFGHEQFPGELGAGQGVLRSTDGGLSYQLVNNGLGSTGNCNGTPCSHWVAKVETAEVNNKNHTYIATLGGLYMLTGVQSTWNSISSGAACTPNCPTDTRFESIAVASNNPLVVYAGSSHITTTDAKIWKGTSTDGGVTWSWTGTTVTNHLQDPPIWTLSLYGNRRFRIRDIQVADGGSKAYALVQGSGIYELDNP